MIQKFADYSVDISAPMVQEFEGYRSEAYQCLAGVWTIGFGHTGGVRPGDRMDREQASETLRQDLRTVKAALASAVEVPVTAGQFIALMSLAFNVGAVAVRRSRLLEKLNDLDEDGASKEFLDWNKVRVGGRLERVEGLTRRRRAEMQCFLRGY